MRTDLRNVRTAQTSPSKIRTNMRDRYGAATPDTGIVVANAGRKRPGHCHAVLTYWSVVTSYRRAFDLMFSAGHSAVTGVNVYSIASISSAFQGMSKLPQAAVANEHLKSTQVCIVSLAGVVVGRELIIV